ncbi:hypothetical protein AAES_105144 [Amazona aestiva]|uniref:Uncharacterized protein n=1 Tax=Amazona aestiva TaxID=12930 RepID=A0A0Q3M9G6_AMAAE|nr:hypothetical protein AAES_105144 [Amazona aestiva]
MEIPPRTATSHDFIQLLLPPQHLLLAIDNVLCDEKNLFVVRDLYVVRGPLCDKKELYVVRRTYCNP